VRDQIWRDPVLVAVTIRVGVMRTLPTKLVLVSVAKFSLYQVSSAEIIFCDV